MAQTINKHIQIIGIPLDLGQSRRGVDMGPGALRYAGLKEHLQKIGYEVEDIGDLHVPIRERLPSRKPTEYAGEIEQVCQVIYEIGKEALQKEYIPLFLGGDHSIAIGSIGGITDQRSSGVIWIDAHGDFNIPETSPNGNIHGMPVAVLLGYGIESLVHAGRPGPKLRASDIVLVGTRDLDYDEKGLLSESGIKLFTMEYIDEHGIAAVARLVIEQFSHQSSLHISLDMDAIDPMYAPGVGTPAPGGLTYRECHLLMEMLHKTGKVHSMDIVEINPILDNKNQTARNAVEFTASLFGRTIL
jgi:arginase